MKIPKHIIDKHGLGCHGGNTTLDADLFWFLQTFDQEPESTVLVAGSHDERSVHMMHDAGYKVTGVDLREYDPNYPPCEHEYVRGDFCNLPDAFMRERLGTFDAFVSLSSIEHFGFGTYSEGHESYYLDVIAMHTAWQLLREGGTAYVTVPYGKDHIDCFPHWRVYNNVSVMQRLIQDFTLEACLFFCSGPCDVPNTQIGDLIPQEVANGYDGNPPHVTILLKLVKNPVNRISPDGR